MTRPLHGKKVLVTRPQAQSHEMRRQLEARGAHCSELPLFSIQAVGTQAEHRAVLDSHRDAQAWLFTSTNAVRIAAELDPGPWPVCYAIGRATAQLLRDSERSTDIRTASSGSNSEALLALPELRQTSDQRFLICTGQGGRTTLSSGLQASGARVTELALYRRHAIEHSAEFVHSRLEQADGIILSSGEGLERLFELTEPSDRPLLLSRPVVVPSLRVIELARSLGFANVSAPEHTSDETLIECLAQAFAQVPDPIDMTNDAKATESDSGEANQATTNTVAPETSKPEPKIEPSAEPVAAPAPEQKASGTKGSAFVAVAMGVIILGLLAVVGYAGWLLIQERTQLLTRIEDQNDKVLQLGNRVEGNAMVASNLKDDLGELVRKNEASGGDLDDLKKKLDDGLSQISRISAEISGGRARFELASVEHLLTLANDRLQIAGDVRGALAAMEGADARLARLADPQMFSVRAKLADELTALRAVPVPDASAASLSLASLIQKIPDLPLATQAPSEFKTPEERDQATVELDAGWDRFVQSAKAAAQSLFTIRRDDDAEVLRLLSPEAETAVFDILTLKLEGAHVSLLKGNSAAMRAQLISASAWLSKQFRAQDTSVKAMKAELDRLAGLELSPELPDISGSLATLRRKLKDSE